MGIPMFKNDYSSSRLYIVHALLVIHVIFHFGALALTIRALFVWGWEEALGWAILEISFGVCEYVMRQGRKEIEGILRFIYQYLSKEEHTFIQMKCRRVFGYVIVHMIVYFTFFFMYMSIRIFMNENSINNKLLGYDNYSLHYKMLLTIIFRIGISLHVYGCLWGPMAFYSMIGFVLQGYSKKMNVFLQEILRTEKRIGWHEINQIKVRLKIYVEKKRRLEEATNLMPLSWMANVMSALTIFATMIITDTEKEMTYGESVFIANFYYTFVCCVSVVIVMKTRSASDKDFGNVLHKILEILDMSSEYEIGITRNTHDLERNSLPHTSILIAAALQNIEFNREILQLQNQVSLLLRKPNFILSSVASIVSFDDATILSFTGHIVNFSVMVISIRNAYRTSNP
jgi:hypothetical protein